MHKFNCTGCRKNFEVIPRIPEQMQYIKKMTYCNIFCSPKFKSL
jgi:hypothetical protein